jgi:hypothetical protein
MDWVLVERTQDDLRSLLRRARIESQRVVLDLEGTGLAHLLEVTKTGVQETT